MDDAAAVRAVEGARDLDGEREGLLQLQRSPHEALRQGLSLEPLHDEEVDAVMVADVDATQPGSGYTPLRYAADSPGNGGTAMTDLLLEWGAKAAAGAR